MRNKTIIYTIIITLLMTITTIVLSKYITSYKYQIISIRTLLFAAVITGILIAIFAIYFIIRLAMRNTTTNKKIPEISLTDLNDIALRRSFHTMIAGVHNHSHGRKSRRRSVYDLPWYLVIGMPRSGKTTLLNESGITFSHDQLLNPNNASTDTPPLPHYRLSNNALLFDMPGAWLDPDIASDHPDTDLNSNMKSSSNANVSLWQNFLSLLVETRAQQPINGMLLTIDIVELIRMSDEQRATRAKKIHALLFSITERLGISPAVYVIITHIDRLAGFEDYFSYLSKEQREQPFGFSFSFNDQSNADSWIISFEDAFAKFLAASNDQIIDRFLERPDTRIRRNIYVFSREFAALNRILSMFFKSALFSGHFHKPVLLRGLYFTSAKQEGTIFNPLLCRISYDYNMHVPILPAHSGHSVRYFIDGFFKSILPSEAGLTEYNRKILLQKRLTLCSLLGVSALALTGSGTLFVQANADYTEHAKTVLQLNRLFVQIQNETKSNGIADETNYLAPLNTLLSARRIFSKPADTVKQQLVATQGDRVRSVVEVAYTDKLQQTFIPALATRMKTRLDQYNKDGQKSVSNEQFNTLRSYLLLADAQRRQSLARIHNDDDSGAKPVIQWMQQDWQQRFEGQKDKQQDLEKHLRFALSAGLEGPLNTLTVNTAQTALRQVPLYLRLYHSLKIIADQYASKDINLSNEVGPLFNSIFQTKSLNGSDTTKTNIPYLYTKRGFSEFFEPRINALSEIDLEDSWVVGDSKRGRSSAQDIDAYQNEIWRAYAADYADMWNNNIKNLDIVDFHDLNSALQVLSDINSSTDPFGKLFTLVRDENTLFEETNGEETASSKIIRERVAQIARQFVDLGRIITPGKDRPAQLANFMALLKALETDLRSITDAQQSGKPAALEYARKHAAAQNEDPISQLTKAARNLPEPLNRFFIQIAQNSWEVVLKAAQEDMQNSWRTEICAPFQKEVAERYPFNPSGKEEVPLETFQKFFAKDGIFDHFYKTRLNIFINNTSGEPIMIDSKSLRVSDGLLKQMKLALEITNTFFNTDPGPSLHYNIEPLSMTGSISTALMNIEGQLVPYNHGPARTISILWPNALSGKQLTSRLSVSRNQSTSSTLAYDGLWSSFRLFDKALLTPLPDGSTRATFKLGDALIKYRIFMTNSVLSPFSTHMFQQLNVTCSSI